MARRDPLRNFRFRLEIDGVQASGFSEVSGLEVTTEIIEYRAGNEPTHVRKIPGLTKYGNVTLKRGITESMELHDWHRRIVDGAVERKSVVVVIVDEEGQDKARFEIVEAWPCRYEVTDLDGKGNDVAIEAIELCNEGIVRVT
jgi:phage tail-like protein